MKKIKILYIIAVCLLFISIGAVFAAFRFDQAINTTAVVGNITTLDKKLISYAPSVDASNYTSGKLDPGYIAAIKQRSETKTEINSSSVICYASEKEGFAEEEVATANNYFYLNQLGFNVTLASSVDVYVRIHFEDAWILIKTINGNTQEPQYIRKEALSASNYPFKPAATDTAWHYDADTNSVYFKAIVDSDEKTYKTVDGNQVENKDANGNYIHNLEFNVNPTYFYTLTEQEKQKIIGRQAILVEVSYTIDVIQANRAKAVWHVDPSKLV